ncbi:hypothetical protein ACJMK2_021719 [Sinanodonta woodiana]|uniref:Enhancer of polycomb-like protein n=1 Tax=Sinanodonta woodiana TaxID=1069815 RepID=A0ABD3TGX3_SINWO
MQVRAHVDFEFWDMFMDFSGRHDENSKLRGNSETSFKHYGLNNSPRRTLVNKYQCQNIHVTNYESMVHTEPQIFNIFEKSHLVVLLISIFGVIKMSKVSFRARALDATKPMAIYKAEEIPDLPDFAAINRSVPQMPTGMEKEEETEHHLQRALSAQQVYGSAEALTIPIPEIEELEDRYGCLYRADYKTTKQYIHIQAFGMDQEIPDYDMDSEDEEWLNEQEKKMEITPLKFEEMMDRLEKGSGQQVVTLQEAKLLLKEDDDLIISVYDYWLNKRLKTQHPLILQVKTEKRDGSTTNNPYVAFRRRTEKMQTRKNRKNDETSYEKMLKLRRDLNRALTLLEFIKRREKAKKEMLQLTIEVLEKRYGMEDFEGRLLEEAEAIRHKLPPFIPPFSYKDWGQEEIVVKKKREYRKRKHKQPNNLSQNSQSTSAHQPLYNDVDILHHGDVYTSEEEGLSPMSPSDHEDENDPDGIFAFRRKKHCSYYAPLLNRLGNWSWCGQDEGGTGNKKYCYNLVSLSQPPKCIGFARRRIGRGGRVIFDRAFTSWDDGLCQLDLTSSGSFSGTLGDYVTYIRERKIPHYRPHSPPSEDSSPSHFNGSSFSNSQEPIEFNMELFESHREQLLLQMQRQQQEQLLLQDSLDLEISYNGLDHSFSSQPTSRFTLDSDSAKFAVSAVISSSQIQHHSATVTSTTNGANLSSNSSSISINKSPSVVSSTLPLTNGPIVESKTTGLSTSPAANVLQFNFPLNSVPQSITSSSVLSSLTSSLSTFSSTASLSSPATTALMATSNLPSRNSLSNKTITTINSNFLKLASNNTVMESSIKQNHEDTKPLNNLSLAMDVT